MPKTLEAVVVGAPKAVVALPNPFVVVVADDDPNVLPPPPNVLEPVLAPNAFETAGLPNAVVFPVFPNGDVAFAPKLVLPPPNKLLVGDWNVLLANAGDA